MVHVGSLERTSRPVLPTGRWFVPPALVALGALGAVFLVPAAARLAVLWCGGLATLAVLLIAGETARRGRVVELLRDRVHAQVGDADLMAYELLPVALDRMKNGELEDEVIPSLPTGGTSDPQLVAALEGMAFGILDVLREKELQRDSAKRAIVNIAHRIQSEIHRLQDDIAKMQFRHGTPEVLSDLMHLEHRINVTGRFATSLAVVGGGAPVRRWARPISLHDVMRAGSGPINEYLRVEQHRVIETAVVGHAVEPLIMIMGELLDNATRYSPPSSTVVMNTEEVATGVEVSIEDKGAGLTDESRRRAEFLLQQGVDGLDLEDLGETARIGLRVAGILASHHGVKLSLRPSTCEGVRAVVFIPNDLLTAVPPPKYPIPALRPTPQWHLPIGALDEETPEYERNANGLPQRRRRTATSDGGGRPAPPRANGAAPAASPPAARRRGAPERRESGLWVDAFFAGIRSEPGASPPADGPGEAERPGP
ncbi:ATP-binding protein [Streptomyces sp. DSM 44915]|uniref:histidine kinase n=1 Tax=Streptomyces chisholmiae TaxID=3075540 RepID=A0ABU2JK24_9ACTN|nr:ATP-binding protein [Streptomyces sp. DSM 44915]MDT0264859.1 ATP-binding protein [Streptomyces sp. DSM 44915]